MKRKARILLVDDDVSLLKLLGLRLKSEGFEVSTAASAQSRCVVTTAAATSNVFSSGTKPKSSALRA